MDVHVQASSGSSSSAQTEVVSEKIVRRSANYHPSIWGDHFLSYSSCDLVETDAKIEEQFQLLKEEVKKMLLAAANEAQQILLNLIDDIQRLGVSYHFEAEIEAALHHLKDSYNEQCGSKNEDDLHIVALYFRLLRQDGHNVSSDVFRKFKDSNGKFKECLTRDVQGMLNLFEATHLRVHGKDILEEALEFTTSHLEHLKSELKNPLAAQVIHALKIPIRKGLTRLESRRFISIYHEYDSHNKVLLNFAKLDFNRLQKVHQGELSYITRWWKDLNFAERLPFARDRVVECYFWILGVYYEPQYLLARRLLTKVISMISVIDDMYDVYGTLEELVLFTDAIERWNISSLDQLPEYMRVCYQALLDVFIEMDEELAKAGRPSYGVNYAKDAFKRQVKAYFEEAKWLHQSYIPTVEEHMQVALVSAGYMMLSTASFVGMGDLATKAAFDWVSNDPLIVRASSLVNRLTDDIVGHEIEQERGHVPSGVECFMKQHGVPKQFVYAEFRKQIINAWKDMNQECLRPTAVAMSLLTRVFNLARVINLLYDDEDGYSNSKTRTKYFVTSVLVDPVPL